MSEGTVPGFEFPLSGCLSPRNRATFAADVWDSSIARVVTDACLRFKLQVTLESTVHPLIC